MLVLCAMAVVIMPVDSHRGPWNEGEGEQVGGVYCPCLASHTRCPPYTPSLANQHVRFT
jgi:hypothetical protein